MTPPQPTASRLIDAYETACQVHRDNPTTATWQVARNTEDALIDWCKWHGPMLKDGSVYAVSEGRWVVIRGVRTCEEMEREAVGETDRIPTAEEVAAVIRTNSVKAWWEFYEGLSANGKRAACQHRDAAGEATESPTASLEPNAEEIALARSGMKINAVTAIRMRTGIGLIEAKKLIDQIG